MKKPPTANEDDLAKHFAKFGLVDHVSVAKDKNGGDGHKGFAFITFQDKQVSKTIPAQKIISSQLFYHKSELPSPNRPFRGRLMFERILKNFQQRPITERRGCKMQNFISFLMVLIFFENFEKKIL